MHNPNEKKERRNEMFDKNELDLEEEIKITEEIGVRIIDVVFDVMRHHHLELQDVSFEKQLAIVLLSFKAAEKSILGAMRKKSCLH